MYEFDSYVYYSPKANGKEALNGVSLLFVYIREWVYVLLKECKRCHKLIPYGLSYCSVCEPIVAKEKEERRAEAIKISNRRYNAKRDPKYTKFYNSPEWRTLSRKRLIDDGYRCVKCGKIATEVDHIKAIQTEDGWQLRLDYNNLQSLCTECHNDKHNRFKKRRPKSRFNGS